MKYNKTKRTPSPSVTVNEAGVKAYIPNAKAELVNRVSSWLVNEPKFYTDSDSENQRIIELINSICDKDPEFIAKLAVYCREVLHLRTAPVVILVNMSLNNKSKRFVRRLVPRICTRADQMTETVAYLKTIIGDIGDIGMSGSMPCGLKRGLADTITKMSDYELSKYDTKSDVRIRDVIALTHPTPVDEEQSELFRRLFDGTIESADTWQTVITKYGSNREGWQEASKKMPLFASIRNLANLLRHECDLTGVIIKINSPEKILKSRIYPHQFLAAYRKVKQESSSDTGMVLAALDRAVETSLWLLPEIPGKTIMLADHSASMDHNISTGRPDRNNEDALTRRDAVNIAMSIAQRKCEKIVTALFSNDTKTVQLNPNSSIIENAESLNGVIPYRGTDIPSAVDYFTNAEIVADRIVILTDDESTNDERTLEEAIADYRKRVNPNAYLHIVNFVGYGTQSVQNSRLNNYITGFTERFLDLIPKFEAGIDTQIKEIQAIEL